VSDHELIGDVAGVERAARIAAAAPWLAISGETNALHAYRERLCLLALNAGGALFVVDLVALRGRPRALRSLEALLIDPARPIWVHGGEYLVAALKRDFQIAPAGLVDGQQAAVLLGRPRTGYRALAAELCGVAVSGPVSVDWAARPLAEAPLSCALDKVRHLPAIVTALLAEIHAADLDDELAEAGAEVGWTPAEIGRFEPEGFLRLKGAHRLSAPSLRVLRALWLWRDAKARSLDVPPGRLVPNERLTDYARNPDIARERLKHEHFHSRLVWGDHEELLQAVSSAIVEATPLPSRRETSPPTPGVRERGRRLKAWRQEEALRRGVGLQAVLPGKALRYLELHGLQDVAAIPGLGARRRERYAATLARLCGGEGEG
jgi:ribonuclease D